MTRRSIVVGFLGTITAISGFISGQLYRNNQRPHYTLGNTILLICILVQSTFVFMVRTMFSFINQRRSRMNEKQVVEQIERYGGNDLIGDRHPKFRYTL